MLSLVVALSLGNVFTLDATDETLEVTTSSASAISVAVSFTDSTPAYASQHATIAAATTTTILAAPAASVQRAVSSVSLCVTGSTANVITVKLDKAGAETVLGRASLTTGECYQADNDGRWRALNSSGVMKTAGTPGIIGGRSYVWSLTATATDAAGYNYGFFKDAGRPGAYSLGTPGLNGVVTDCSVVGTAGSGGSLSLGAQKFVNASSGTLWLSSISLTSAAVGTYMLIDALWYNTGLVVTTTTAQTVTTPTLPARDSNGSSNGDGVELALYTTTANTNAAVIATTSAVYTDSDGNPTNTAAFFGAVGFQAPATPVIGTWLPFNWAAGDTGIRALTSITLGTSYGAGALTAMLYRPVAMVGVSVANTPTTYVPDVSVPLYPGSCLLWVAIGNPATTAPVITAATVQVVER
jgi:hypothetical protein